MIVEVIAILASVLLVRWQWRRRHLLQMGRQLGPGVMALPLVGHSYLFIGDGENRMKAFQTLGLDAVRNGGLAPFWLGTSLLAVVADPVVAELVLKTCLEKDDVMEMAKTLIGNGSIFAPVRIWRPRRKIVSPNYGMKNLKHFVSIFAKQSAVMVEQMRPSAGAGTVAIWKYLTAYTLDSIAEATLGCNMNAQSTPDQPFLKAFDEGLALTAERIMQPWLHNDILYKKLPAYAKQIHSRDYVWRIVTDFIQSKRKELKEIDYSKPESDTDTPKDGLQTFLELLVKSSEGLTDMEVLEEIMVTMIAGNDTSAVGAAFATVMLARHQDIQERVYQELQEVFGDSTRAATMADLPRLKYLDAMVRETLRLYPPAPNITRKVNKDIVLPSGVRLVAGSGVLVNIWALHRNPRYWGEDVDLFRPERFLEADKHPAFMPFSHGPRNCLGYQFAMMSMKTALSSLLRQYRVMPATEPTSAQAHPPLRLKFDLMMKDVDNFEVQIEFRNKPNKLNIRGSN